MSKTEKKPPSTETEELAIPKMAKVKREPWRVGVTTEGDEVWAPVAGTYADRVLHLRGEAWPCRVCRATVHKRHAVVDAQAYVYHSSCYDKVSADPDLQKQVKEREASAIRSLKGKK